MTEENANESDSWNVSPSKGSLRALQSDVTPITAIKELVDNAIDNARRLNNEDVRIDIELRKEKGELVIKDNAGGIKEEKMSMMFTLGASREDSVETSIGSYGMGAKKAIIHLGHEAEVKSRHSEANQGYGFRVDEDWLEDETNWELDKIQFEEVERGETAIEITKLKSHIRNAENIEEKLVDDLRKTYELFLDSGEQQKGRNLPNLKLDLRLNGEKIEPREPLDWSFTPFDSFHPKRYENIKIDSEDLEEPVNLNITVGLLREGDQEEAGTDIYCQKRKILAAETGTKGGFNRSGYTPGLSTGQWRLKVIIEFEGKEETDKLPWDTQKNDINLFNPIIQKTYNEWFPKFVKPYIKANYENLPGPYTELYDENSEYAENNGEITSHNYEDRERNIHKPDTDFSDKNELEDIVEKHEKLGIKSETILEDWQRPVYTELLDNKSELVEIEDTPDELDIQEFHEKLEEIENKAEEHAEEEKRYQKRDDWWYDFYLEKLDTLYRGDLEGLETVEGNQEKDDEKDKEEEQEETKEKVPAEPEIENVKSRKNLASILEEKDREELENLLNQAVIQENKDLRKQVKTLIEEKEEIEKARKKAEKRLEKKEENRKGNIGEMRRAVDEFEDKLDEGRWEGEYQDDLKENPWFFGAGSYVAIDDEVEPFKGVQNDFLIEGTDGYSHIVELKRPDSRLFLKNDEKKMHSDLRDALSQLARYLYEYQRKQLLVEADMEHNIMNPKGIIVIGRMDENKKENIKRLQSVLSDQVQILTYDNIVSRARTAIEYYDNSQE